jgi:hypothetical protein
MEDGTKLRTLKPGSGQTVTWRPRILDAGTPWVAVVIPDGDMSRREELMGPQPQGQESSA